jgi:hypothetical protein
MYITESEGIDAKRRIDSTGIASEGGLIAGRRKMPRKGLLLVVAAQEAGEHRTDARQHASIVSPALFQVAELPGGLVAKRQQPGVGSKHRKHAHDRYHGVQGPHILFDEE